MGRQPSGKRQLGGPPDRQFTFQPDKEPGSRPGEASLVKAPEVRAFCCFPATILIAETCLPVYQFR